MTSSGSVSVCGSVSGASGKATWEAAIGCIVASSTGGSVTGVTLGKCGTDVTDVTHP